MARDNLYIRLEPTRGWVALRLRDLWLYRELLFFLTWRDIKVRYKQTVLGMAWAVLQPFMTMVVFSLFFGGLARIPSDGIPYPIFSYAALVPWAFFSNALAMSANSLVISSNLLKKVYFPRLVIPIATVFSGIVDFLIAFGILLVMMLAFGVSPMRNIVWSPPAPGYWLLESVYAITPTANIIWLPLLLLLAMTTALGVGLWLSAMNVQFRDVQYTIPFIAQLWLFITPIAYPSSLIQNELVRNIYALNPMVGVVEGFRWALLGTDTAPGLMIIMSALVAVFLFVSGLFYFKRMEKTFADVV
jgi:lipopolysaccharide transport system permease protein